MAIALEIRFIGHMFYYTAVTWMLSRFAPFIPIAKARGFTALFGYKNLHQVMLQVARGLHLEMTRAQHSGAFSLILV